MILSLICIYKVILWNEDLGEKDSVLLDDIKSCARYRITRRSDLVLDDVGEWLDEEKGKVIAMIRYITQEPAVVLCPDATEDTSASATSTTQTKRAYRSILECRGNESLTQHFETFCNYVLIHFCSVQEFRKVCSNKMVSDIYTKSDEVLGALLLENNADDLLRALRSHKKIQRCDSRPKFTRCGDRGTKYQGWNAKGIMRFNWYMSEVAKRRGRKGDYEEEQESEMKGLYRRWNGTEKTYTNMITVNSLN